ncbi:MAG: response regulator [Thermoplasmatota archaeon]
MKVLLADDEPDILESTKQVLEIEGFEVEAVQDARRVLGALRKSKADLLLQDANMPNLDLDGLVKSIRTDPTLRRVKVLLFTASVDAAAVCARIGADGCVPKPFDATQIRAVLEAALQPPRGR